MLNHKLNTIQKFYLIKETRYLTHNFHPYPNKFIPQIARTLIKEYSNKDDTILDPFCGSGTSLIEANLLKRNAIGIDINPLACLISRAKTTPLEINKLNNITNKLLSDLSFYLKRDGTLNNYINRINPSIPKFPKQDYWFQESVIEGLNILRELINKIEDKSIKDFCLVAFSSLVKEVSDASSLYRLTKLKKPKQVKKLDIYNKFKEKINEMTERIIEYNQEHNSNFIKIYQKDSRCLDRENENKLSPIGRGQLLLDAFKSPKKEIRVFTNNSIDFIITNPPNFNFDFSRCFGIYFWWLDFGNTENKKFSVSKTSKETQKVFDIKELDRIMIGTKKVNSKSIKLNIDFADNIIEKVKEKKNCTGIALSKYYYDIKQSLAKMYRLLKEDKIEEFLILKRS